jgi:hypothetical protein
VVLATAVEKVVAEAVEEATFWLASTELVAALVELAALEEDLADDEPELESEPEPEPPTTMSMQDS